jgi:large subunit ribosomal protein L25
MKTITIEAQRRDELGKKSTRDLRKMDHVPCVMYGGPEVIHFHAHENDFRHIVYSPTAYLIEVKISGKSHKAVLQDLQFHPVTDKLFHMDFVEVFDDKPVTVELPIHLVGSSIGIKNGGKSRQRRRVLKVRGLIAHMPEALDLDITKVDIGDVVKIGDLSYENLEILDPPRSMVYAVVSSRVSMKGMEIEEPEAEGEEGEAAAEGEEAPAEASAEEGTEAES